MIPTPNKRLPFTSTKTPSLFLFVLLSALCLAASPVDYLQQANEALERKDLLRADFYMTRYLAKGAVKEDDAREFIKRRRLDPGTFFPSGYDSEFIQWFTESTYKQWAVGDDKIKEKVRSFEIATGRKENYFVTMTATPALQTWFQSGPPLKTLLLAMATHKPAVAIYAGKLLQDKPAILFPIVRIDAGRHFVHHVWTPEFLDLDGDRVPEIWIRYNLTGAEGFEQVLEVYKIQEDSNLELLGRFKGSYDGVARRLDGGSTIETLTGEGSKPSLPRAMFDQYEVRHYQFQNGEFEEKTMGTVSHILRSKEWKKYYLPS